MAKDRVSAGKDKTSQVRKALRDSVRLPVGSVHPGGAPVAGGVVTTDVIKPLKHPTKEEYRWPSHPHLEAMISGGVVAAADAPLISDADASDPGWATATEDDTTG